MLAIALGIVLKEVLEIGFRLFHWVVKNFFGNNIVGKSEVVTFATQCVMILIVFKYEKANNTTKRTFI